MSKYYQSNASSPIILFLFPAVLSSSSNGHRSMVFMIQKLVERGFPCGILVKSISQFNRLSTLSLPKNVSIIGNDSLPKSSICVIATDVADPCLIDKLRFYGHRILWWLMAPLHYWGHHSLIFSREILLQFTPFCFTWL